MKIFNLNTNGILSIKGKTKDFYQMLISGPIICLLLLFAFKYTIDSKGYFTFLAIFLTIIYLFTSIIVPISLMIRIKKVVRQITIDDNHHVRITTNKDISFDRNEITFKKVENRFTGFSKRNKNGILIETIIGKEFWIIEDFFNDYDELKNMIIDNSIDE